MGLDSVVFNKEFKFEPQNAEGLDLDFSYNQFSPNPNLVAQFVMKLVCSPSIDPIAYTKEWITKNSILNNIPTDLRLSDGFVFSGQTKLGSPQSTYVEGQGQNTEFNLLSVSVTYLVITKLSTLENVGKLRFFDFSKNVS